MQLLAHRSYLELNYPIHFWRTKTGLEVDFILGNGEVAVEVKGSRQVHSKEMKPLAAFYGEFSPRKAIIVCNEKTRRNHGEIQLLPWKALLDDLWLGKTIS